jgi:hypothetical protein
MLILLFRLPANQLRIIIVGKFVIWLFVKFIIIIWLPNTQDLFARIEVEEDIVFKNLHHVEWSLSVIRFENLNLLVLKTPNMQFVFPTETEN